MGREERRSERGAICLGVALVLAAAWAVFTSLGVLAETVDSRDPGFLFWFNLDRGRNPVTAYAALLLVFGGLMVACLAQGKLSRSVLSLAVIFAFMGLDEAFEPHERAEQLSGVDWQIVYLPVYALAAVGWLTVVVWQWGFWGWIAPDRRVAMYDSIMVAEESLEMLGSSTFALALVCMGRS